MPNNQIKLVGHRGLPECYPENTLLSLDGALKEGADAVECDVQFSEDGVPFLLHDLDFSRTSKESLAIGSLAGVDLMGLSVHEPNRFGEKFKPMAITPLSDICGLMQQYPKQTIFVELKIDSLKYLTAQRIVEKTVSALKKCLHQVVIISYDQELLKIAKAQFQLPIGWVLKKYDNESKVRARDLSPEYLICNYTKFDELALWQGPWQWFAYDIVDMAIANKLKQKGVLWLESWDIRKLRGVND